MTRHTHPVAALLAALAILAVGAAVAAPAAAQTAYNHFPGTAATDDGRFVALAGDRIETLAQDSLTFFLAVPPGETQFELGIFDGETGQVGSSGQRHWDNGSTQLQYALYYDPFQQGSTAPANLVGVWRGNESNPTSGSQWTASSPTFPDNAWWNLTVNVPEPPDPLPGQAPSSANFYHLCVSYRAQTGSAVTDPCTGDARPADTSASTIGNFKLRATTNIAVLSFAFAYEAALRASGNEDLYIIYPEFDGSTSDPSVFLTTPTTYDGSWTFFLDVPTSQEDAELFGGDFDFGTGLVTGYPSGVVIEPCVDDDDPDTPNDPSYPPFAVNPDLTRNDDSLPEGARLTGGSPPDDNRFDAFRRSPCINWTLTSPGPDGDIDTVGDNVAYDNDNPSSQREWELFRISSEPTCNESDLCDPLVDNCADFCEASPLPAGTWRLDVDGVDLSNLNAWHSLNLFGFCINCTMLPRPYLVGDTVFADLDEDGDQAVGEAGIPGVLVELLDGHRAVIDTRLTGDSDSGYGPGEWQACQDVNSGTGTAVDDQGLFCFDVSVINEDPNGPDSEVYTIRIADSNFQPGGALYEFFSGSPDASLPSPEQSDTVVEGGGNVLAYDFGYFRHGSIGDRVWLDSDGDGIQDAGENGINGVTVNLLDADGSVVATTVTSTAGDYLFDDLQPGDYTVEIDASTLPAEVAPTFDLDGLASPNEASVSLGPGEDRTDVDFGYGLCGDCEGKMTRLLLQFNGTSTSQVTVKARRGPMTDVVFDGTLAPGEAFEVVGPATGNPGFAGTLGTEIRFFVDGSFHVMLHTSCSVEIGPGTVAGDFEVLSAASKNGGLLCPVDGEGENFAHDDGQLFTPARD